jgi:hypothetical protein
MLVMRSRYYERFGVGVIKLAIAHTIVHVMGKYKDEWQADLEGRGQHELEELRRMHIIP